MPLLNINYLRFASPVLLRIQTSEQSSYQEDTVVYSQHSLARLSKLHKLARTLAGMFAVAALIIGIVSLACVGPTLAIIAAGVASAAFCSLLIACAVKHCIWHIKGNTTPVIENPCHVGNPYCDPGCRCKQNLILNCGSESEIKSINSDAESIDCENAIYSSSSTSSTYQTCEES